ncbi:hypothetical protein CF326_g4475 [Tilletia indica]|nr:hypothetical protein CF326_g4475 [Tilletia indica]
MPRRSSRSRIEEDFTLLALAHVDQIAVDAFDADQRGDTDSADEDLRHASQFLQALEAVHNQRYLSARNTVARINITIGERLLAYEREGDRQRYRQLVRMEPAAFRNIVSRLSAHPTFNPAHGRMAPIEDQVAIALFRFGHDGNGASVGNVAELCAYSEGSIVNFTRRTVKALCALETSVLCWASESEKEQSKAWVQDRCGVKEWRNGYASVDGVHIICAWGPGLDHGDSFMNRKRRFSFNVQLITLVHTLRIIGYVVGHRGASSDARAWACSPVVSAPRRFLDEDEWIWADLGYPYASYLVSPYQHLAATKAVDFRRFNYCLSNIRIRSEHAMAYVKGRFSALKGYRGLLATAEAEEFAQDFIVAALVAHNLAMQHDDAGRYLLYVREGLERDVNENDADWSTSSATEEAERAAEQIRERAHEAWSMVQREGMEGLTATDREALRIEEAKERREELHDAFNRARGITFEDTTWRSRQKELSRTQQAEVDRRRLEAHLRVI